MLHLYCGNGKGKTTAAMGLALRVAGTGQTCRHRPVSQRSRQRRASRSARLPQVTLLPVPDAVKFSFRMTEDERRSEAQRYQDLLKLISRTARGCFLLVLDEACAAVNTDLLPLEDLLACLDSLECEVVLTGRDPAPELMERADYITSMEAVRHPFEQGITAREGIEF